MFFNEMVLHKHTTHMQTDTYVEEKFVCLVIPEVHVALYSIARNNKPHGVCLFLAALTNNIHIRVVV